MALLLCIDESFELYKEHEVSEIILFLAWMAMEPFRQFGNWPYKEYMCGIYFEFRPVVHEETLFKIFFNYSSGGHHV